MEYIRQRPSTKGPTGLVASLSGLVAACVLAASFSSDAAAQAGRLTFANGKAAFVPPPGFKTLTADQQKQLLPTADDRMTVIGDVARGSTISYAFVDVKLTRAQMDRFRLYMTEHYTNTNPALKWVVNKLDKVGGRDGYRMEFSDDREMYHVTVLGHVDDDHAVMMGYNVPIKEWPKLEPAIRASVATLQITP